MAHRGHLRSARARTRRLLQALGIALLQPVPPDSRVRLRAGGFSRRLEFFKRRCQALRDLRQLTADEALQRGRLVRAAAVDSGAQRAQGLQQVLDVVRQAGAGFVYRVPATAQGEAI